MWSDRSQSEIRQRLRQARTDLLRFINRPRETLKITDRILIKDGSPDSTATPHNHPVPSRSRVPGHDLNDDSFSQFPAGSADKGSGVAVHLCWSRRRSIGHEASDGPIRCRGGLVESGPSLPALLEACERRDVDLRRQRLLCSSAFWTAPSH